MFEALKEAQKAKKKGEVPIGCVIVRDNKIIARAHNRRHKLKNAVAHAEVLAIKKACKVVKDWRLQGCEMYVTLEPCPMCAGACFNARVDKVVYGATDVKGGVFGGALDLSDKNLLNHKIEVIGGVLKSECEEELKQFFKNVREAKSKHKS